MNEKFICCICGNLCEGFGNNPDGAMWKDETGKIVEPEFPSNVHCCDECDSRYVIPGRMYKMYRKGGKENEN